VLQPLQLECILLNGVSADGRNVCVMQAISKNLCGRNCLICTVIAINKDNTYASRNGDVSTVMSS
jgi:hypothetical protein